MNTHDKRRPGRPSGLAAEAGEPHIRDAILQETISLLSETGVVHFSLKEVSRRAGVTPAAVYYYFGSKKALLEETLDHFLIPIMRGFHQTMAESSGPAESVRALQEAILRSTREAPWFLPLWSREIASSNGTLRDYMKSRMDISSFKAFIDSIRQGQRDHIVNEGILPEMAYLSIITGTLMPLLAHKSWSDAWNITFDPEVLERHIRTVVISGFLGEVAAAPPGSPDAPPAGKP
jgi:AcrR family transcriptional regulator